MLTAKVQCHHPISVFSEAVMIAAQSDSDLKNVLVVESIETHNCGEPGGILFISVLTDSPVILQRAPLDITNGFGCAWISVPLVLSLQFIGMQCCFHYEYLAFIVKNFLLTEKLPPEAFLFHRPF